MTEFAIETHGLGKRFGDRAALQSIDLQVPRGCAFGSSARTGPGRRRPSACCWAWLALVGAIIEEPRFHGHGASKP
jgi:ABC-2 type transport system ATP-binding protein